MNKRVQKAGAVILHPNESNKILLLYSDNRGWQFPKGHMEAGESAEQTMHREVKEETGLDVTILVPLPDISYVNESDGDVVVHMYLVRPENTNLQLEKVDDKLSWVDLEQVADTLSFKNLQDFFSQTLPTIKKYT